MHAECNVTGDVLALIFGFQDVGDDNDRAPLNEQVDLMPQSKVLYRDSRALHFAFPYLRPRTQTASVCA